VSLSSIRNGCLLRAIRMGASHQEHTLCHRSRSPPRTTRRCRGLCRFKPSGSQDFHAALSDNLGSRKRSRPSTRSTRLRRQHPASIVSEELLDGIARRHGFRAGDYSLVWDGGEFDSGRHVHQLAVVTGDGRHAVVELTHAAISQRDTWKYLGKIEAVFSQLARRKQTRGV